MPTAPLRRLRRMLQAVVEETAAAGVEAPFFEPEMPERPTRAGGRARSGR